MMIIVEFVDFAKLVEDEMRYSRDLKETVTEVGYLAFKKKRLTRSAKFGLYR